MAKPKKAVWGTDFERFFHNGEWDRLLRTTIVPNDALTHPPVDQTLSWDRRAAWLVYVAGVRAPAPPEEAPDVLFG